MTSRIVFQIALVAALTLSGLAPAADAPSKKYEANWASLDARPTPAWYSEARFGIFIHWGVYSVPGWAPKGQYAEWYWKHLEKPDYMAFHVKTWGEKFKYQDFAPQFKAELFEPERWADIFQRSGAKYIVLTSKHHDGFCLWPSADAWNWNSMDIGPHRDLCGELGDAVRAKGIKMGYYFSLYEWYHPWYKTDVNRFVDQHMIPQFKDLVRRYKPAVIFSDGEWEQPSSVWKAEEMLAWLFNEGPNPDEVVIDDRWGKETRGVHGGYYTTEYFKVHGKEVSSYDRPWEECRGIGASFGVNRNENLEDYQTRDNLVKMLVEIVSRGGNLLLDIGPSADGTIPVIMEERLLQLGDWLKINGAAVYGTGAGPVADPEWGRSTLKDDTLYLFVTKWPEGGELKVSKIGRGVKAAYLLSDPGKAPLRTDSNAGVLTIQVPVRPPDTAASVIALELAPKK